MLKFFKFNKNNLLSLIISIVVFFIILFVYKYTIIFSNLENNSVSFRFKMRDPFVKPVKLGEGVKQHIKNPMANDDIMILGLDLETIREFGDMGIEWPYPWSVHAKFTDFVTSGDPNTILFDIMFLDHKSEEKILADAFKRSGKVFVDYPLEVRETDNKPSDIEERMELLSKTTFDLDPNDSQESWVEEIEPPTPIIAKSVAGMGYANVLPDEDHVNRKMPLISKFQGKYYPSIDLQVLMNYYGITKSDVEIKIGEYIKLKNVKKEKMKKPNDERVIEIPIDSRGFMNINFIGSHGSFQSIPYFYFYADGEFPNDSIKDKILLVAAYAITGVAKDTHDSPYGETFGIEHHANAINTVINQDFLYTLTENQNLIIMLIISLLLGFLIPRLKIIFSMIFTIIFMIIYVVIAYLLFDNANFIIALSTPMFQTAATFTFIIALRLLTEQKEKRYIRSTFSKFVSKSVVDQMLQHPDMIKLGGEDKILTVLFSDIRGFTSISEVLSAQELVQHLNEYLQAMTDLVIKYNGTLDKYVGDEIMAFWGAPIPQDDHHLLACKCALEMMAVLKKLNANWEDIGKPPLYIGIGINTGGMVVGNMGSNSRMDYTLMGDNVNLGARLEGTNKVYKTNIIISEYTYEYVKDRVFVRELDLIKVKGKEKPVKIYELIDVTE